MTTQQMKKILIHFSSIFSGCIFQKNILKVLFWTFVLIVLDNGVGFLFNHLCEKNINFKMKIEWVAFTYKNSIVENRNLCHICEYEFHTPKRSLFTYFINN